jgi:hypothetical protein
MDSPVPVVTDAQVAPPTYRDLKAQLTGSNLWRRCRQRHELQDVGPQAHIGGEVNG